ncbi:MAG: T9SS type A sorting domain-containing protein [Porphyromonadaceae bacterium]|nr:T9SS type A sorting domain-containing protein [Porphyromonadaceae bacterium]
MKKTITLSLLFAGILTSPMYAQGNLFTPADCDSNGWLWFDTQEKIDKYVGDATSDKLILSIPTLYQEEVEPDVFESLSNTISSTVVGVGTDGNFPGVDSTGTAVGTDAKTGAIVLAPANPYTSFNGGSILLHMPSCYSLSVFLSAEVGIRPALKGGLGELEFVDLANVKIYIWTAYHSAGQCTWEVQDFENTSSFKLNQEEAVTAQILNGNTSKAEMYVHGIKAQVYGEGAGVISVQNNADNINLAQTGHFFSLSRKADVNVYDISGKKVFSTYDEAFDLSGLSHGLYFIQVIDNKTISTQKVLIP